MADETERAAIEEQARRLGWAPKDKFRGPESKWRDAPEYIEFVNSEFPVLRERVRTLSTRNAQYEQDNSHLRGQIGELNQTLQDFRIFSDKRDERAYKKARADIQREMDAAVDRSDPTAYREAKGKLEDLDAEAREAAEEEARLRAARQRENGGQQRQQAPVDPEVQSWLGENAWFNQDPLLNVTAMTIHAMLKRDQPGLSLRENLDEVTRQVKEAYPAKFGIKPKPKDEDEEVNPRVAAPSGNEDEKPARRASRSKTPGWDELPQDAKDACNRMIKNKMIKDRDEYVKEYYAQED